MLVDTIIRLEKGQKMIKRISILTSAVILMSIQNLIPRENQMGHHKAMVKRAVAVITPTKGNSVNGSVTFEETDKGIHVVAHISGLLPGNHGFHIHEYGDIRSDDGSSSGGHFNPMAMPHNMPMSNQRHLGDMGNIVADEKGNAYLDYVDPLMKLDGENSIIGHAVIVHAKEDDFKTQPTGNAGARIGQGVIGIGK
jgi:superoxide dismutase, Cu-Zn family